jgi:DNA-binding CsgD family transcriptional regulator
VDPPPGTARATSGRCRTRRKRPVEKGKALAIPVHDEDGRLRVFLTLLLVAIAVGGAVDLWLDWPEAPGTLHIGIEAMLLALSLGGIAFLWSGWMRTRRSLRQGVAAAQQATAERDAWRARAEKLLRGLGEEIDAQLRRWSLTPAERQVALLLLKGYGHKEIAALLERSERTVRQHAVAVYRKSNLSGRAELSAFFLEDLLLPPEEP